MTRSAERLASISSRIGRSVVLLLATACASDESTVPGVALVSEIRIDGRASDFVPIRWLGVAPDGRIAITQPQDHSVRFFDPNGQPLATVGRRGQGPGEFESIVAAGWIGDTLWVAEGARYSLVSPRHVVARTMRPPPASVAPADRERLPRLSEAYTFTLRSDGSRVVSATVYPPYPSGWGMGSVPIVAVAPDGAVGILLTTVNALAGSVEARNTRGPPDWARIPFHPPLVHAVAPDGDRLALVSTSLEGPEAGTFRVTVHRITGDTAFSRTYPFTGAPIPRHVADSAMNAVLGRSPPHVVAALRDVRLPSVYPPIESVVLGRDGTTWVELRETAAGRPWLILDGRGEPIATTVAPPRVTIRAADSTHVWALERDDDDVESVIRYRIDRGVGGE